MKLFALFFIILVLCLSYFLTNNKSTKRFLNGENIIIYEDKNSNYTMHIVQTPQNTQYFTLLDTGNKEIYIREMPGYRAGFAIYDVTEENDQPCEVIWYLCC